MYVGQVFSPRSLWLTSLACTVAVRTKVRKSLGDLVDVDELATEGCPNSAHVECKDALSWLEHQQALNVCMPYDPMWIRCSAGLVPTTTAWSLWKPGDACSDYYEHNTCLFANQKDTRLRLKTASGGKCLPEPILGIRECEALRDEIEITGEQWEQGDDPYSQMIELAMAVFDVYRRAPEEWFWLPSVRSAVLLIAGRMVASPETSLKPLDKKQACQVWRTLLMYCVGAQTRELRLNDLLQHQKRSETECKETARKECRDVAQFTKLFPNHPWRALLQLDSSTISSLEQLNELGFFDMGDELLPEFVSVADSLDRTGRQITESFAKVRARFHELLLTAGDRGEYELELGLALSSLELADGIEPVGGKRRLEETVAFRELKNLVSSGNPNPYVLEEALKRADSLFRERGGGGGGGEQGLEWVNAAQFAEVRKRGEEMRHLPSSTFTTTTTTASISTTISATTTTSTTRTTTTTSAALSAESEDHAIVAGESLSSTSTVVTTTTTTTTVSTSTEERTTTSTTMTKESDGAEIIIDGLASSTTTTTTATSSTSTSGTTTERILGKVGGKDKSRDFLLPILIIIVAGVIFVVVGAWLLLPCLRPRGSNTTDRRPPRHTPLDTTRHQSTSSATSGLFPSHWRSSPQGDGNIVSW